MFNVLGTYILVTSFTMRANIYFFVKNINHRFIILNQQSVLSTEVDQSTLKHNLKKTRLFHLIANTQ